MAHSIPSSPSHHPSTPNTSHGFLCFPWGDDVSWFETATITIVVLLFLTSTPIYQLCKSIGNSLLCALGLVFIVLHHAVEALSFCLKTAGDATWSTSFGPFLTTTPPSPPHVFELKTYPGAYPSTIEAKYVHDLEDKISGLKDELSASKSIIRGLQTSEIDLMTSLTKTQDKAVHLEENMDAMAVQKSFQKSEAFLAPFRKKLLRRDVENVNLTHALKETKLKLQIAERELGRHPPSNAPFSTQRSANANTDFAVDPAAYQTKIQMLENEVQNLRDASKADIEKIKSESQRKLERAVLMAQGRPRKVRFGDEEILNPSPEQLTSKQVDEQLLGLQKKNDELRHALETKDAERKAERKQLQAQLNTTANILDVREKQVLELVAKNEALSAQQQEFQTLKAQSEELATANSYLQTLVLQDQEKDKELYVLKAQSEELSINNADLQCLLSQYQAEAATLKAQYEQAAGTDLETLQSLRQAHGQVLVERNHYETEFNKCYEAYQQGKVLEEFHSKKIADLEGNLQQAKSIEQQLHSRKADLEQKNLAGDAYVHQLRANIASLERQVNSSNSGGDVARYQAGLHSKDKEIQQLMAEKINYWKQNKELTEQNRKLKASNSDLTEMTSPRGGGLLKAIQETRLALREATKQKEELEERLQAKDSTSSVLQAEYNHAKEKMRRLEKEVDELMATNSASAESLSAKGQQTVQQVWANAATYIHSSPEAERGRSKRSVSGPDGREGAKRGRGEKD